MAAPSAAVARKWPHRVLNLLPRGWREAFVLRHVRPSATPELIDFAATFSGLQKGLLILPDDPAAAVLSLGLIEFLRARNLKIAILCRGDLAEFFRRFFPGCTILAAPPDGLFWGEPPLAQLAGEVRDWQPDVSLDLCSDDRLLCRYLQLCSGAKLRVGLVEREPFYNLVLRGSASACLLSSYESFARLLQGSREPTSIRAARILPDPAVHAEISAEWAALNLGGAQPLLFAWDNTPGRLKSQTQFLEAALKDAPAGLPLLIASTSDLSGVSNLPAAFHLAAPCFANISLNKFISLACLTGRVLGMNGPALHLAAVCGAQIHALLGADEVPYDTSAYFPNFHAIFPQSGRTHDAQAILDGLARPAV